MKILGLLGYPISHSFSPRMINRIARDSDWDCCYHPFSIPEDRIEQFIEAVKLLPVSGFNVTIPYKGRIVSFCDQISSEVQSIGAANTIVNDHGKLLAENSDVYGFKIGLQNFIPENTGITGALILGAGGAARAVAYVLLESGYSNLFVATRNLERKEEWERNANPLMRSDAITFMNNNRKELEEVLNKVNLIVQATPVGTWPNIHEVIPFPFEKLDARYYVYDLIYNPQQTRFMALCQQNRAHTKNGLDMLAAQAARSLECWGYKINDEMVLDTLGDIL